ncbi:MAG: hypothetical protein SCH70_05615 [Candidatus Methanoperedens sp.]|nr:hypothetical protein [Candidatus Methanoperedens sp.]
MKFAASDTILEYFNGLETGLSDAIKLANCARANDCKSTRLI